MIKSYKHKGLALFYTNGVKSGIQPHHANKLQIQLTALSVAESSDDLRAPIAWRLHVLGGNLQGYWSLTVNGNWRLIFKFDNNDVELVDYLDYD